MIKTIMDFFLVYLGNWQIIGMFTCFYYLMLKSFKNKLYFKFWNSIEFNWKWIPISLATLVTIILREYLLYPITTVQSWMPQSYFWEQFIMWLYTTHTISILVYSSFIFYFWKKYNSFFPAFLLGLFSVGIIEFTFVIQHLVLWNMFLGFNWYAAFGVIMMPFIVEYKKYYLKNYKRMIIFLVLAFINQYIILPVMDYSITVFVPELLAYRLNYDILPHPPIQTWLFYCLGQSTMKIFFLLALSNIRLKEESK